MSNLQLRAADGHEFSVYLVRPEGTPRGAVVVVQEAFGVNSHIRRVVEQFAAEGYVAGPPRSTTARSAAWTWATARRTSSRASPT